MLAFLIITLVGLFLGLLLGSPFYFSERPPDNTPSEYLKMQPTNADQKSVVVLMGDSITHGRIGINYVEMIKDQMGNNNVELINAGKNSELAWNLLQRVDKVIQCDPDIVTILVGTNDANASMSKKTMKSYVRRMKLPRNPDIDWYKETLSSLIDSLKDNTSAKIALISIPTIGEDPDDPAFSRSTEYSKIVQEVSKERDVMYLPLHELMVERLQSIPPEVTYSYEKYFIGILKGIINHYSFRKGWDDIASASGFSLHVDYLHLNTKGAQLVADLVTEFLESTLIQT
jgi:lysophospholipase L1-like esterase